MGATRWCPRSVLFASIVPALVGGCSTSELDEVEDEATCEGAKCDGLDDTPEVRTCVGLKGNGPLIAAHFGALARIVEERGVLSGVAGGSSGSMTAFVAESIAHNPLIEDCTPPGQVAFRACSEPERRARAALLFKSFVGFLDVLGRTREGLALDTLLRFREGVQSSGAEQTLEEVEADPNAEEQRPPANALDAVAAVVDLLRSQDVRSLANPEVLELITSLRPWRAIWFARDIVGAVADAAQFKPADHMMFVRSGVVDFDALARMLGRVSSFYIGPAEHASGRMYGPYAELDREDLSIANDGGIGGDRGLDDLPSHVQTFDDGYRWFLDGCASRSIGLGWDEVSELPVALPDDSDVSITCGELFAELLGSYQQVFRSGEDAYLNRVDDLVGRPSDRPTAYVGMAVTAVLRSERAIEAWHRARRDYVDHRRIVSADAWLAELDDFEHDVGMGYWATTETLAEMETPGSDDLSMSDFEDLKSAMFTPLADATWFEALGASPAEPGLARGIELGNGMISVGGWSDPQPVQALVASGGCDEVVAVTSPGASIAFAERVAEHLGGADHIDQLFDVSDLDSSVSASLAEADAVYCSNWNAWSLGQNGELFREGYLEGVWVEGGRPSIVGCSAGASSQ